MWRSSIYNAGRSSRGGFAGIPFRVNAVFPGPTATNLGADLEPPRGANDEILSIDLQIEQWQRLIPMGRIGVVDDIAPVVAFLASDASRYMTGTEVVVDGGYTAI